MNPNTNIVLETSNEKSDHNLDIRINDQLIFLLFLILIIFDFFQTDFPPTDYLDTLHDGDYLATISNHIHYGGFWNSAFTVHGGENIFLPLFAYKFLNSNGEYFILSSASDYSNSGLQNDGLVSIFKITGSENDISINKIFLEVLKLLVIAVIIISSSALILLAL